MAGFSLRVLVLLPFLLAPCAVARASCGDVPLAAATRFTAAQELCGKPAVQPRAAPLPIAVVPEPVVIPFPDRVGTSYHAAPRGRPRSARQPTGLDPAVAAVGTAYRIDPRLLQEVVQQESRFRADAVSPKGARGLMQIMPATARELGVSDPALLSDPLLNLVLGARYLKQMQARFGNDLPRVLAAYNAGPGAVARHGGVPPYAETRGYVSAILGRYQNQLAPHAP